ncbi:MAG: DUF3237 domain-containing protein [Burkholderiales bacterium]|nr:DUF3237 domain-containing protein [Burkholderiales bacterium]
MDTRIRDLDPIATRPLFDIVVDLHPKQSFGAGPLGTRVLHGSAGGTFEGPQLRGTVLPIGGDWALYRPDGAMQLDVRLALRTSEGDLIHMTYGGRWIVPQAQRAALADARTRHAVDPASYYFRTTPLFETGSIRYAWLNDAVCIGSGYLVEGGVAYKVFQVL